MAESTDAAMEVPPEDLDLGRPAELEYAGFWSRVAALIVDNAIVTIFGVALLIAASAAGAEAVLIANLAWMLVAILYWPLLESSERQATIGKQLLGIQVVDANGARLSFVRALLRNLAKIISSLPFGLGFLLAAFTPRKQALHDMITKCLVVRAGPSNFRKAVIAAVGALVITIAGSYYYFTEVYLPQMDKGMKQAQKGVTPATPAPAQPPVAKAPVPAPAQPAPVTPKVMTPEELAAFEKKVAEARRERAKVAAAPSPAPAAQPEPAAPAPAKPAVPPAVAAKPEPKPAPKPESKPVAVAAAKPKPAAAPSDMPKPPPPVVTAPLVSEPPAAPPAAPPARPAEPVAPAAPRAAVVPAVTAYAPLTGIVRTPKFNDIMTAVMFRDPKAVAELLEYGWWVDRPDSNGVTPLMAAAWNGDAEIAQILLKAGADPNRYARGGSVLDYAGRSDNAQVIELLKRSGAR